MSGPLNDLEQLVLLALLRLGPDAYGVTIAKEIARRASREVGVGAIYKVLSRLEERGFVGTRMGEPTPERGGRRKRHYHLLTAGRAALARSLETIRRMSHGLTTELLAEDHR